MADKQDDTRVYICWRVKDLPRPFKPAEIRNCPKCGVEMWIAKDAIWFAERCEILCCRPCASTYLDGAGEAGEIDIRPIPRRRQPGADDVPI